MKKKTQKVIEFLSEMHNFIVKHSQFRKKIGDRSEAKIQGEIRWLLREYLEKYFVKAGFANPKARVDQSFYWEGQEGEYGKERSTTFGTKNYPDFIITDPYVVAIEYKQSESGSVVKQGIGQSIMHTLSGEFDFVYYLFHDQSADKRIENSIQNEREASIIERIWNDFNVQINFV
jgi:hypothetical protein